MKTARWLEEENRPVTDLALFGALGDLSLRKLYPALYHLDREGLMHDDTRILALARQPLKREVFCQRVSEALSAYVEPNELEQEVVQRFLARLDYLELDFTHAERYYAIKEWRQDRRPAAQSCPLIVYLAVPASLFGDICRNLQTGECLDEQARVVVEKPIGYDFNSSCAINDAIGKVFPESRIYRIDHYLGKETVQNLIALRFANPLFGTQDRKSTRLNSS